MKTTKRAKSHSRGRLRIWSKNWRRCENYTRNECRRCLKLHSKRVEKMWKYTRNECGFQSDVLIDKLKVDAELLKSGFQNELQVQQETFNVQMENLRRETAKLHSFRVCFCIFSTRCECVFVSFPLVSIEFLYLFHSFRVSFIKIHMHEHHSTPKGSSAQPNSNTSSGEIRLWVSIGFLVVQYDCKFHGFVGVQYECKFP